MTFQNFEERFKEKASKQKYSQENIDICIAYAKPLIEQKLPVIFNTEHFSRLVGYKKSFIKKAVLYPSYFYREFKILKKNKKPQNKEINDRRIISEPLPSLKEIQHWILKNILYEIPVSRFAKAYIPKRNLLENVKYHKNKDVVISLDVKDYFSSIKRYYIEKVFFNLGYSSNVSNLLSKLCCLNDCLPQGAPTSPYLSNIYMYEFDSNIETFCKKEIRYTRYADDLTFSGKLDSTQIIDYVRQELNKKELSINEDKISIMGQNKRQIVTGVVVNQKLQVVREKRDKIRQEVYYIKKFGLLNHLEKTKNPRDNYVYHLLGKINFVLYINKNDSEMKEYYNYIKTLLE